MKINTLSLCFLIMLCCNITNIFASYRKNQNFKYILIWFMPDLQSYFHNKYNTNFVQANCHFKNCLIIHDKEYFEDTQNFDAIIFFGPKLQDNSFIDEANENRSPKQIYIFATQESAQNYPVCYDEVEGFFNLTWTYRLDSNLASPYIIVKDINGKTVGPKENMNWIKLEDMKDINEDLKKKLRMKHKRIAWLLPYCNETKSNRLQYAMELIKRDKGYLPSVDVYGPCGQPHNVCENIKFLDDCWQIVEENYYFYLSFEDSFSEDYVTEVLQPLKHYTVPIVLGTANYTRFMPDGIYLNAKESSPYDIISKVSEAMSNEEEYFSYFKWHNHYSYHDPDEFPDTNKLCALCYMLNDEIFTAKLNAYEDFRQWWNEPSECGTTELLGDGVVGYGKKGQSGPWNITASNFLKSYGLLVISKTHFLGQPLKSSEPNAGAVSNGVQYNILLIFAGVDIMSFACVW